MSRVQNSKIVFLVLAVVGGVLGSIRLARTPDPSAPLSVGLVVWPPYEMPHLAQRLGRLPATIRLVDYRTPTEALRAYRDGTLDAVALTSHYAQFLAEEDPSTRVILIVDASTGGDALVARPGLESVRSLRGKRIAFEPGVFGEYMLARVLSEADLSPQHVERVPLTLDRHLAAYTAGQVDALVTYEPQRTQLLEAGARVLFQSAELKDAIHDVLIVRRAVLETREQDLRGRVRAWCQAVEYYRAHPRESAAHVAPREQLSPKRFQEAMAGAILFDLRENRRLFAPGSSFHDAVTKQGKVMKASGLLRRDPVPLDQLLDARLLED